MPATLRVIVSISSPNLSNTCRREAFHAEMQSFTRGILPEILAILADSFAENASAIDRGLLAAPLRPESGIRVVELNYLLSLCGVKHSSDQHFAVQIAWWLLTQDIGPNGRAEISDYREFPKSVAN